MLASYARILRRSAAVTAAAAAVMVALSAAIAGSKGALGALLGTALVAAFFAISVAATRRPDGGSRPGQNAVIVREPPGAAICGKRPGAARDDVWWPARGAGRARAVAASRRAQSRRAQCGRAQCGRARC